MNSAAWIVSLMLLAFGEGMLIWRLTRKYERLSSELSRASAKVAQHRILIRDDADLDKCLQEEVTAKFAEDARDVRYEQNKARYDAEHPESPWVPRENPK